MQIYIYASKIKMDFWPSMQPCPIAIHTTTVFHVAIDSGGLLSRKREVTNCCQIGSYTLPEILLEIFEIAEIPKSVIKKCWNSNQ